MLFACGLVILSGVGGVGKFWLGRVYGCVAEWVSYFFVVVRGVWVVGSVLGFWVIPVDDRS